MEKKQSAGRHDFNLFKKDRSPFYYVRIMHKGERRKFSTGETTIRKAESKAVAILADIRSRGWSEAIKIHSRRRDKVPNDPKIDKFVEIARKVFREKLAEPPSRSTYERYLRDIDRVAKLSGAKKLSDLDEKRIDRFITLYKQKAIEDKKRDAKHVASTLRTILRSCSALFAPKMLKAYQKLGLEDVRNPFAEVEKPRVKLEEYSPLPANILKKICEDAQLLKVGDPEADEPKKVRNRSRSADFREPQVGCYLLFLLELGLGLRRNEADKAQWDWILPTIDGSHILEVRETPFFQPKSKQKRKIPVPPVILRELTKFRRADDPFIVPGNAPKTYPLHQEPKNISYRCEESHRALVAWLQKRGVTADKPCHLLRKEFGSAVATTFGLFAAQKMLGHSNPQVTAAHYAGLTQLPQLENAGFYNSLCGTAEVETPKETGA